MHINNIKADDTFGYNETYASEIAVLTVTTNGATKGGNELVEIFKMIINTFLNCSNANELTNIMHGMRITANTQNQTIEKSAIIVNL